MKGYEYDYKLKQYNITITRHHEALMVSMVIPFICFNILVGLVYLLPPSSGERVGYSITLVLTFSVLLMSINNLVPSNPKGSVNIGELTIPPLFRRVLCIFV